MADEITTEQIKGIENNIDLFAEAVAKAERLGKEAREAAEASTIRMYCHLSKPLKCGRYR